jgi:hypothetical protein
VVVTGFRTVITEASEAENLVVALSPAGDGLLQITKIS